MAMTCTRTGHLAASLLIRQPDAIGTGGECFAISMDVNSLIRAATRSTEQSPNQR